MKVFKFGGASVNTIDRIKNVGEILGKYTGENLMIIISAMGKTTNALEKVAESFFAGRKDEALQLFDGIKKQHLSTAKFLLVLRFNACISQLSSFFTECEWLLHDTPVKSFDYYYDQIVCMGELLSTCIVSHYLEELGISNTWLDVRDILRTDNNFREAIVDWNYTSQKVKEVIIPSFQNKKILITQGFIGATNENETTTLGREGSDFSAAIFANLLEAESLTIWKDVEGVMSADPKIFPEAILLSELSYEEVIEMAYYGAQVIHPKTIKPLQNKAIPLKVKCFLDPSLPGTIITQKLSRSLPPILIIKHNQVLMHLHTQDFSFVGEKTINILYKIFSTLNIRPNLIQTGAISLQLCLDDKSDKIESLAAEASAIFDVQLEKCLTLLTIRHFSRELLDKMTRERNIVLIQQTRETVQVLYQDPGSIQDNKRN